MQRLLLRVVGFWHSLLSEEHHIHRRIKLHWSAILFCASDTIAVVCSHACDTETDKKNRRRDLAGNNRFHLSNDNLHAWQFDCCVDVALKSYVMPMKERICIRKNKWLYF